MQTSELKKQFTNIIEFHYESELWHSRPEQAYTESMEPFLNDLISVARCHKQGLKKPLYQFEIANNDDTDSNVDSIIGKKIEELRTRRGWTLAQLAKRTELNVDYLQSVERGESILRMWAFEQIVCAFKVKSSAILPF